MNSFPRLSKPPLNVGVMESSVIKIFPILVGTSEHMGQSALVNFAIFKTKQKNLSNLVLLWFALQIYLHSDTPEFGLQNRFDGVEKSCAELFKEQSDSHVNSFPLENSMFS